jgi:hypothetical protein
MLRQWVVLIVVAPRRVTLLWTPSDHWAHSSNVTGRLSPKGNAMKIRKTLMLAAALSFVFANAWSPGVALAAIDAFLDFTPSTPQAPPVKGEKAIKARPVSSPVSTTTKGAGPAATGSSGGGGGHHK